MAGPLWLHTPDARSNTHKWLLRMVPLTPAKPPTNAVLPSPDSATPSPKSRRRDWSTGTILGPCCFQTPPVRVKHQAAPIPPLSSTPVINTVLPSPDTATFIPCCADPMAPEPTSLGPC